MFLRNLKDEQKELFLDLCIHAARANEEITGEEIDTICQYCDEMCLIDFRTEANMPLSEVVSSLIQISTKSELKAIAIEIIALMMSDKKYDGFEKEFVGMFFDNANISEKEHALITEMLNELDAVYKKLSNYIKE
jgi:hypothetical protein